MLRAEPIKFGEFGIVSSIKNNEHETLAPTLQRWETYLLSNDGRCVCYLGRSWLGSEQSRESDGGVGPVRADNLIFELLPLQGRCRRRDGGPGSGGGGASGGARLRLRRHLGRGRGKPNLWGVGGIDGDSRHDCSLGYRACAKKMAGAGDVVAPARNENTAVVSFECLFGGLAFLSKGRPALFSFFLARQVYFRVVKIEGYEFSLIFCFLGTFIFYSSRQRAKHVASSKRSTGNNRSN